MCSKRMEAIMKFKNKTARDGYVFGCICKLIGEITFFPFLFFLGSTEPDRLINTTMIIPCIVSIVSFVYGIWRTGGISYEED